MPSVPSIRNYVAALHAQYGNADAGFLPQSFKSHTKDKLQRILRILGRTGLKLGGKMSDKKGVLAERLARWLNRVLAACREVLVEPSSASSDVSSDDLGERSRTQKKHSWSSTLQVLGRSQIMPVCHQSKRRVN